MSLSLKIIHFLGQIFWLIDTIFFQMKFPFTPVLFSLRIKAVNTVSWIGSSPSEYQHTNYENQQDKFVFWQGVKLYFCIYIRNFVQTADMCFISEIYLTQNNLPSGREHEESFYLISGDPFWLPPFWTRIMSEFQRNTKVNKKTVNDALGPVLSEYQNISIIDDKRYFPKWVKFVEHQMTIRQKYPKYSMIDSV